MKEIMMQIFQPAGSDYKVHTEVYEGPLNLLLELITKAELDITILSLAKVTQQYLEHLRYIQETSATDVSHFLVIAAKLIQIKSEAILPRPPERAKDEEDPGISLARQLRIYKAMKTSAAWLNDRFDRGLRTYVRLAPPPVIEENIDLKGATPEKLAAFVKALYQFEENVAPITSVVTIPKRTIKNKIKSILDNLKKENRLSYKRFLTKESDRIDAIIIFLAILELVKQQYVVAQQTALFNDIELQATEKIFNIEEITLAMDE